MPPIVHTSADSDPSHLFTSFTAGESEFKSNVRAIGGIDTSHALSPEVLLVVSALMLELLLAVGCIFEAHAELGAANDADAADVFRRVRLRCGLDVAGLHKEAIKVLGAPDPKTPPPQITLELLVREAKSILEYCPIEKLEEIAIHVGLGRLGHRCRNAYTALRAFTLRSELPHGGRLRILGQKYSEGTVSLEEIATLLDLRVPDAVAVLEQNGFERTLEVISLSGEERSAILQQMTAERLRRNGRPAQNADFVTRSVIASSRIEGVDARRWFPLLEQ